MLVIQKMLDSLASIDCSVFALGNASLAPCRLATPHKTATPVGTRVGALAPREILPRNRTTYAKCVADHFCFCDCISMKTPSR